MKFSRKKKNQPEQKNIVPVEPENGFYSHSDGEAPLDEYTDDYGRQIRRTSQHSPARRREKSNRATSREIALLMLKVVLIPALVVVAFLGLKFVLNRVDGPSEKDTQEWDVSEKLMESGVERESELPRTSPGKEVGVDQAFLEEQMTQWELTERHLRAAEALNQRENRDAVVFRLNQALRYTPDNQAAQKLLLDLYMKAENFAAAAPLCIRLLNQDSQNWETKLSLLKALYGLDETGAAVVLANQMLTLQPGDLDVMEMAAYAHAAEGDTDRALKLYDRILQNDRTHVLALEGSGYIYQWLEEWQEAVPYYLELLKVEPKVEHYHALARCYAKQNEGSKAVIFLGQATSLYGEAAVAPWLNDPDFDLVRETVDFRALAERIVKVERQKSVETIRRRETEKQAPEKLKDSIILKGSDLDILRPRR